MRTFIEEYFKENKKRFIITVLALVIWIGLSVYLSGYDYDKPHYEGNLQYCVRNRWPEWTPFHNEKYGLMDEDREVITEPRFDNLLSFKEDGYAWDYRGHYVDRNGNIVVTNYYYLINDRLVDNPEKFSLYAYIGGIFGRFRPDDYFEELTYLRHFDYGLMERSYVGEFSNGLAKYQTLILDEHKYYVRSYGYIDMNGEMVIAPKYMEATDFDENGFAIVGVEDEDIFFEPKYTMIDTGFGKTSGYLFGTNFYKEIIRDENGNYCAFLRDNRSGEPDAIMDSEGNIKYMDGESIDGQ